MHVVIAGAGLAGACTALALAPRCEVTVLEAERPAAGASGAAAGLVNPLMGRRPRALPFAAEALAAFYETAEMAGAESLVQRGLLRPASSAKQARSFRRAAEAHPEFAEWLDAAEVAERFAQVPAPHGALAVHSGASVDVPAFVRALLRAASEHGAHVISGAKLTGWSASGDSGAPLDIACERRSEAKTLAADRLVLALGYGLRGFPVWDGWGLHGVKGQVVRMEAPAPPLPLAGNGYVVPAGEGSVIAGSSYDHDFTDLAPDDAATAAICAKVAELWPPLAGAPIREAVAGVRVGVPVTRRPRAEALPDDLGGEGGRVYAFTGLGSRGLLLAPLYARRLAERVGR